MKFEQEKKTHPLLEDYGSDMFMDQFKTDV